MKERGLLGGLVASAGNYGIAQLVTYGLPFLLLPIWTRYLSPAEWGQVALAETIGHFVAVVLLLGLPATTTRLWYDVGEDARKSLAGSIATIALMSTLLGLAVVFTAGPAILAALASNFSLSFYPLVALGIVAAVTRELTRVRLAIFQVNDASRSYALFSISGALLSAAAALLLVVSWNQGAVGVLGGRALGLGLMALAALYLLVPFFKAGIERRFIRDALRFGLPLVPHQIVAYLLIGADRFVLEALKSTDVVGEYSVAYSLASGLTVLGVALVTAWGPHFYDKANDSDEHSELANGTHRFLTWIALAAVLGMVIAEPVVDLLLGDSFASSGSLIPIIALGTLFHAWFLFFQLAIYQAKRTMLVVIFTGTAAALNLALNLLFVPSLGAEGAALATAASYLVECLLVFAFAQRAFLLPYASWKILLQGLACVAFAALVTLMNAGMLGDVIVWSSAALVMAFIQLNAPGKE